MGDLSTNGYNEHEFFPNFAFLGTLCGEWVIWLHSVPRGGINSAPGDSFLAQRRQEVQGGEPPPCPRGALSLDLALAFTENPEFPGYLPGMGDIR